MTPRMLRAHLGGLDLGIMTGAVGPLVAQELSNTLHVGPAFQKMGRASMPQQMRVNLQPHLVTEAVQSLLHRRIAQPSP